jgi:predicted  nucleic acid-binding Zn-ribbon protein
MIEKLYNLKKTQTDRKLMQKALVDNKIEKIKAEIMFTKSKIDTASVDKFGAISDFAILAIHKNTMRLHISDLEKELLGLNKQIDAFVEQIIELQKETEQFSYLLEEEKKEALRKLILAEEEASSEYIQSKYITG